MDTSNLATKKDIQELKTKNTKIEKDIKKLETKIDAVEKRLNLKINSVEKKLEAKIDDLEERMNTKLDKIMNTLDWIVGAIDDLRTDNTVGAHHTRELKIKVDDHEKRLKKIETSN